ncbi:interferon alpha-inducible protein 27-like protein 1 isoform 2-T2 [Dama dama]|uniref:interferon alpha-inducible protein 27-like protein 2A isoform X2 n=1 Tax=Dama dama TaxID=30532 RepID=UPI002A370771|nr:interferon alpha-inducible protein 27-like protein 2A isoform X2 [Dama dama]
MIKRAAAAAIGGALAVAAVPAVLGAVGFTGAGIAASSIAAKMMSAAAVANGGGVAAGSLVATLQSVDLMDCSPPGSSVHGISQARIPEWVAISFSSGSSHQESNPHLLHWQVPYHGARREAWALGLALPKSDT